MADLTKFARLGSDGYAEFPPQNSPDGKIINCNINLEWLTANGYSEQTEEWFEEHRRPEPEPVLPTVYTKRKIRLAMRALNIEDKLNAVLQNGEMALQWNEAQDIDLNNAQFQEAFQLSGVTEEQLAQIMITINSGELDNVL